MGAWKHQGALQELHPRLLLFPAWLPGLFYATPAADGWQIAPSSGIGRVHRIPPVKLKSLSAKRERELAALVGGDQGSAARRG
jgi:hypothetical protein